MLLKIIALFSMVIDHSAIAYFDNNYFLRILGRFAFPIFAIIISYNFLFRTSNQIKMLKRLFVFALISQIPYSYFIYKVSGDWEFRLNIFFTFLIALSFIWIFFPVVENKKPHILKKLSIYQKYLIAFILLIFSFFSDYSFFGVLFIIFVSLYFLVKRNNSYQSILSFNFEGLTVKTSDIIILLLFILTLMLLGKYFFYLAPFIILIVINFEKIEKVGKNKLKINPKNKIVKAFFYFFYPIHLFFLALFI